MPHNNPFFHGNPVTPDQLIGRKTEVRKIAGRICTGQSTAIMGSPRSGKTSILEYLIAPENKATLYGDDANKLIFSSVEASTLGPEFSPAQFWECVLKPLQEHISISISNTPPLLSQTFQICQENNFLTENEFEKLIVQLQKIGWRFILMLDEFDFLLHHPLLNSVEFFGALRKRFSLSKGALVLITTANISRKQLNQKTQHLNPTGSPYFNFIEEVTLGALSETQVDELLQRGDDYFKKDDHLFIKNIAGGHPYLLQVAASLLWDHYEYGTEKDSIKRQQRVEQDFRLEVIDTLNSTWLSWSPRMQQIFTSIALAHLENLKITFPKQIVDIKSILSYLPQFNLELNELTKYGFLIQDENIQGGWRIYPSVFLYFVVSKLKPEYSSKLPSGVWENLSVALKHKVGFF